MFDMIEIGRRIANYRKEKGMTQMGLANQLGVSYQAVSNWERGESMPDIAKLEDLSRELGASIDEILGNDKKSKAAEILSRGEIPEDIKEVLPELLPVMTPEQIDESVQTLEEDTLDVSYLVAIAPFVDKEIVSELALKMQGEVDPMMLCGLAPFLKNGVLDKVMKNCVKRPLNHAEQMALFPFMTKELRSKSMPESSAEEVNLPYLISIAPFVGKEKVSVLALQLDGEVDPMMLCGLAPFLEHGVLDSIIKKCVKRPLNHVEQMGLAPFLSRESLTKLLLGHLEEEK